MSSTVETLDWSNVRASVVSLSSARPMINIGWMEVLTCAKTETTGLEVDTEMFTTAVDLGDVLMFSASARHATNGQLAERLPADSRLTHLGRRGRVAG